MHPYQHFYLCGCCWEWSKGFAREGVSGIGLSNLLHEGTKYVSIYTGSLHWSCGANVCQIVKHCLIYQHLSFKNSSSS